MVAFCKPSAHVALVGLVWICGCRGGLTTFVTEQLPGLAEALSAGGALKKVVHAREHAGGTTSGTAAGSPCRTGCIEGAVGGGLVCASVAHQGVLLFKAHLAVFTVEWAFLRVGAFVLSQVGRALEALPARGTAKWPSTLAADTGGGGARKTLEVQLAKVALEQVLTRVGIHVTHEVGSVLEALLATAHLNGRSELWVRWWLG